MTSKFTINVSPRTKKNHGQIITLPTGKPIMVASKQYREFESECIKDLKKQKLIPKQPIDSPINLKCKFYKEKDYKGDLVGYLQAVQDTLVKAKVLLDDNHKIVASTDGSEVLIDRNNPRIEVEITKKFESND